ncbi:MAG: hypothetical protein ACM3WV_00015 [Bacillota bacterium]
MFDSGVFAGVSYYNGEYSDYAFLSAGYKYKTDDNSYAAFSIDYNTNTSEITGCDLDGSYYADKMKISGQLYLPAESGLDPFVDLGVNYQISDDITGGARLINAFDNTGYVFGATWNMEDLILNGKIGSDYSFDYDFYAVGLSYQVLEQLNLGADFTKYEGRDDAVYAFKIKYSFGEFNLCLNLLYNTFGTP